MSKVSWTIKTDPPPISPPPAAPTPPGGGGGGGSAGSVPITSMGGGGSNSIPLLNRGSVANLIIPPGGFAGFAQQTAATQAMFQRAGRKGGMTTARRRKRKTAKKTRAKTTRKRTTRKRPARLKKGSAAAKRYMASIRRKRKR